MEKLVDKKLLITGGGTGGHVSPGIAVAQEWQKQGGPVSFVGTQEGRETVMVPKAGFNLWLIKSRQLKRKGFFDKMITLCLLPAAVFSAIQIIRREKPDVILGTGGYVSGPACLAGWLLRVPIAVADQNAQPGITNRILGSLAKKVFVSFEESGEYFNSKKTVFTGNPVRAQIVFKKYLKHTDVLKIFVTGGSQGAVGMNKIIIDAIKQIPELWTNLEIKHQASKQDIDKIKDFYLLNRIKAKVLTFFENMSECFAESHVVISRAGASTVYELAMSGRPAIFFPYPYAADDHQTKNAEAVVNAGGGWLFEQLKTEPNDLAKLIQELYEKPDQLKEKADGMAIMAKPEAASHIVAELVGLIRKK